MIEAALTSESDFDEWRCAAREFILRGIQPDNIVWRPPSDLSQSLFTEESAERQRVAQRSLSVPSSFVSIARLVVAHNSSERFDVLYRTLWRLQCNSALIKNRADADIFWLENAAKAVRRDLHKMKAFVRFRKVDGLTGRETFVAWFEPDHWIVELVSPFFQRRFAGMNWTILTPRRSVQWDGADLTYGPGATRDQAPAEDAVEEQWKTYFSSIFNPARVKVAAMTAEMPKKYWKNLPEATLIPGLIADSRNRVEEMREGAVTPANIRTTRIQSKVSPTSPNLMHTIDALNEALTGCASCGLCEHATQVVPGEGLATAPLVIVGEQPGDLEDLEGRPLSRPRRSIAQSGVIGGGHRSRECLPHQRCKALQIQTAWKAPIASTAKCWRNSEMQCLVPTRIGPHTSAAYTCAGRDRGPCSAGAGDCVERCEGRTVPVYRRDPCNRDLASSRHS